MFPTIKMYFYDEKTKKPIENILARIYMYAKRKNDYIILASLSDQNGMAYVTEEMVKEQILMHMNMYAMDYASGIEDCENVIEITLVTEQMGIFFQKQAEYYVSFPSYLDQAKKCERACYDYANICLRKDIREQKDGVIELSFFLKKRKGEVVRNTWKT